LKDHEIGEFTVLASNRGRFLSMQSLHLILDARETFTFIYVLHFVLLDYLDAAKYFFAVDNA
jgi:hypothetical protein